MRALTIRQPWAGLIVGSFQKSHNLLRAAEVRKWTTSYRGKLLIHAGVAVDEEACGYFQIEINKENKGIIVGFVDLQNIIQVKSEREWNKLRTTHLEYGGRCYGDNTFVWILSNPVLFSNPIPCLGKLGLWVPPREVTERLAEY